MARSFTASTDELRTAALDVPPVVSGGTVAFWLKPNWNGADGATHVFGGYWHATSGAGGELSFQQDSNLLDFGWNAFSGNQRVTAAGGTLFTNGRWRHYCYVWDSTGSQVFVDGVSVGNNVTAPLGGTFAQQTLGQYASGVARTTMNGSLSHWCRWGRRLSQMEAVFLAAGGDPIALGIMLEYKPLYGIGTTSEMDLADPVNAIAVQSGTTREPTLPALQQSLLDDWFDRAIQGAAAVGGLFRAPILNGLGVGGPFFQNPLG